MEINQIYDQMLSALQNGGIHEVAEAAFTIMKMPVTIADASYIVMALYPKITTGDAQWDTNEINQQVIAEAVIAYQDDHHWDTLHNAGGAVCIDWGYYKNSPRYAALLCREGQTLGSIAFLIGDTPKETWHLKAVDIIAQVTSIALARHCTTSDQLFIMKETMMNALLSKNIHSWPQFMQLSELTDFTIHTHYILAGVWQKIAENKMFSNYIRIRLTNHFPHTLQLQEKNRLYFLMDGNDQQEIEKRFRCVKDSLKDMEQIVIAFSDTFTDIFQLPLYKDQADSLLSLYERNIITDSVLYYQKYSVEIIMDLLSCNIPEESLLHPVIQKLKNYDHAYNTDYLNTLKTYICSCYSKNDTSETLAIHRNTLNYRLERIEELIGIPIKNARTAFHLLVSFYYLDKKKK